MASPRVATAIFIPRNMSTDLKIAALQQQFPELDRENIEETIEACAGDLEECVKILRDILSEEAAEAKAAEMAAAPPSIMRVLFDGVSHLALLPREAQRSGRFASGLRGRPWS